MIVFKAIYLTIAAFVVLIICVAISPIAIVGGLIAHAVSIGFAKNDNYETI